MTHVMWLDILQSTRPIYKSPYFLLKCLLSIYTSSSFVRPSSFIGVIMISATAAGTRQLFPLERWTYLIIGISPSKPRVESTLIVQLPSRHM